MRVFARNSVLAKSKFWYHMKRQHKVRKIQGEIVNVSEVRPLLIANANRFTNNTLEFSRTTESFLDTCQELTPLTCTRSSETPPWLEPSHKCVRFREGVNRGIDMEMSGRHRAPHESIQIVKTSIVPAKDARREHARVYSRPSVKFPKVKSIKRAPVKSVQTTFKASRPIVF